MYAIYLFIKKKLYILSTELTPDKKSIHKTYIRFQPLSTLFNFIFQKYYLFLRLNWQEIEKVCHFFLS